MLMMKIEWLIIDRSLAGKLSEAEQEQLDRWLSESPAHVKMYERIKVRRTSGFEQPEFEQWREEFRLRRQRAGRRLLRRRWLRFWAPAAALAVMGIGICLFELMNRVLEPEQVGSIYTEPDRTRVHLTTSSGQVIELASLQAADTLWMNGTMVKKEDQTLCYRPFADTLRHTEENTIDVPRGCEYSLQLSDGTKVWLNSASRMTYPVAFGEKNRKINFAGEGYFEVAPDAQRPFIVEFDGMEIRVLGTEFNLNTRSSRQVRTVLVRGKVSVALEGGKQVLLQSGEMAETDIVTGDIRVKAVPVWQYTAWQRGEFAFENATIEEMLNELALWFDLDVVYNSEVVRKEVFTGCLSRNLPLPEILRLIENTTYVRFTVEGHRVIVSVSQQH